MAVDDGKFFVFDEYANLTCFDALNGEMLWQTTLGGRGLGGLLIKDGTIYAGKALSVVQAVDEATGTLQKQYEGLRNVGGWKGPPKAFFVDNGRIFIEQDGCNAYNITTGEILWTANSVAMYNPVGMPYTRSVWSFEDNLVLGEGLYYTENRLVNGYLPHEPR